MEEREQKSLKTVGIIPNTCM